MEKLTHSKQVNNQSLMSKQHKRKNFSLGSKKKNQIKHRSINHSLQHILINQLQKLSLYQTITTYKKLLHLKLIHKTITFITSVIKR